MQLEKEVGEAVAVNGAALQGMGEAMDEVVGDEAVGGQLHEEAEALVWRVTTVTVDVEICGRMLPLWSRLRMLCQKASSIAHSAPRQRTKSTDERSATWSK